MYHLNNTTKILKLLKQRKKRKDFDSKEKKQTYLAKKIC